MSIGDFKDSVRAMVESTRATAAPDEMRVDKTNPERARMCATCEHEHAADNVYPCSCCWNPLGDTYRRRVVPIVTASVQPSPSTGGEPIGYVAQEQLDWLERSNSETACVSLWRAKAPVNAVPVYLKVAGGEPATDSTGRDIVAELVKAMRDYQKSVDGDVPQRHRDMMRRADAFAAREPAPVARDLPDLPEMLSLADIPAAQETPESWDADYRETWQKLQVADCNRRQWRAYALELRAALAGPGVARDLDVEADPVKGIITGVREFYLGLLSRHLPSEAFDQARADDATTVAYRGVADRFLVLLESATAESAPASAAPLGKEAK